MIPATAPIISGTTPPRMTWTGRGRSRNRVGAYMSPPLLRRATAPRAPATVPPSTINVGAPGAGRSMHDHAPPRLPADAITRTATPQRTKLLIGALGLLVVAIALCLNRDLNGDLYLLLFSGRYIAHHGPVGYDPFPTIQHGHEWLNQQWLSEVGFYGAERVVGTTGITVLYAVLIGVPLALLLAAVRRK